jgi:hypothetical protein
VLRYHYGRDVYVGRDCTVDGETFTNALDRLVNAGHDPAAVVDLLVREIAWSYGGSGVRRLDGCPSCGRPSHDGFAPFCGAACQAAAWAGDTWRDDGKA